jgi:hypothetical protein
VSRKIHHHPKIFFCLPKHLNSLIHLHVFDKVNAKFAGLSGLMINVGAPMEISSRRIGMNKAGDSTIAGFDKETGEGILA